MKRSSEPRGLAQLVDRGLTGPAELVGLLVVLVLAHFLFVLVYVNPQTDKLGVAQRMVVTSYTGMLTQEAELRGFLATGEPKYLESYAQGVADVASATTALNNAAHGLGLDQSARDLASAQDAWQQQWARPAAAGAVATGALLNQGKSLFDAYRGVEARVAAAISAEQVSVTNQANASLYLAFALSILLALAFAIRWFRQRRLLTAYLVEPIKGLVADVHRMAAGDLSPTSEARGPKEIQAIASALRQTAGSLTTARRALIETERRTQQVLDGLPAGVFVVDALGATIYANAKSTELLGKGIDPSASLDTVSDVYGAYVVGTDSHYLPTKLPISLALAGESAEADIEVHAPERTITLVVRSTPLRGLTGEIIGAVAIFSDVTEVRDARDLMRKRSVELERSNHDLEQFAYVASHDLQEPLRMVASYVQLLERRYGDRLGEDGKEFIGFAVDGATRMQALIAALLGYSKLGRLGAPLVDIDMTIVVERAMANLTAAIAESGAEVSIGPMPHALGDVDELTQVFQNLIGNAVKFSGDKTPRVEVTANRHPNHWEFSVSDNGIGIDPAHRDRVFLMFQRLHGRDRYPGTGIGLTICKKIIERHSGTIWIDAAEGGGTLFHFTLPSATSPAAPTAAPAAKPPATPTATPAAAMVPG